MSDAFSGGCDCGAVRYEVTGEPVAHSHCQCRQCQRQTGTGHGSYVTFAGSPVTVQGEPRQWEVVGEGGTVKHSAFCGTCGSPLYFKFPAMPEIFVARAGSLDDPSRFEPQMVLWTKAAQPWDELDPELTRFEKMPPPQEPAAG